MLVLDPIPVVIEDAEERDLDVPFSPKDTKMGSYKVRPTRHIFMNTPTSARSIARTTSV
jgi:glutaminyl-tRNA synthetase